MHVRSLGAAAAALVVVAVSGRAIASESGMPVTAQVVTSWSLDGGGTPPKTLVINPAVTPYSNISTFSGTGLAQGDAGSFSTSGGTDDETRMVADDIEPVSGFAGAPIITATFSAVNFGTGSVTLRPFMRLYSADGASGGPGTILSGLTIIGSLTLAPRTAYLLSLNSGGQIDMPTGNFWAGAGFDDADGTTGASLAQLSDVGQGYYGPTPDVGSSADVAFETAEGSFSGFVSSDPSGATFNNGGDPVANFGWEFIVPEPASAGLVVIAGAGLLGRRRRGEAAI